MKYLWLSLVLLLAGCLSGLGAGDSQPLRFFSAALPQEPAVEVSGTSALRWDHLTASRHLRDRMVWRNGEVEFGYYETRRWTELPLVWVVRGLRSELLERHGVGETQEVSAPALDLELVGFEEQLVPHEARVALDLHLADAEGTTLLRARLEEREPIERDSGQAVARATRAALARLVTAAADEIAGALNAAR